MEDYKIKVLESLEDEMDDVDKYIRMSKVERAEGKHECAAMLRETAREELKHAKRLWRIYENHGWEVPEDVKRRYAETEQMVHEM